MVYSKTITAIFNVKNTEKHTKKIRFARPVVVVMSFLNVEVSWNPANHSVVTCFLNICLAINSVKFAPTAIYPRVFLIGAH